MIAPKFFLGPMTLNAVDAVIEISNEFNTELGLIPSRRQVDYNRGYVNNWNTDEFCGYVKSKTKNILIVRDHSGPLQGATDDDGIESLRVDCKPGNMDVIHIDPWKAFQSFNEGVDKTIEHINFCHSLNDKIIFEVNTEEAIRKTNAKELKKLMEILFKELSSEAFNRIKYLVIQSGTALKETKNIGTYDKQRLLDMIKIAKDYGLHSKEHNGDYLEKDIVREKFSLGLNCINIAPEIGQMETLFLLNKMKNISKEFVEEFFNICYESKKWCKWVSKDFMPFENKEELIKIAGHYVLSEPNFLNLKGKIDTNDEEIKFHIKNKIKELCSIM